MKRNVLIYPAGADNAIEIYQSIKHSVHLNVYGASAIKDISQLIYENEVIYLPFIDEDDFLPKLNKVIEEYNIDFLFPTHDAISYFLSENQPTINAKCKLLTSNFITNKIARHKNLTYDLFKENSFNPVIYKNSEEVNRFPIFIKPIIGEGSKGIKFIKDKIELEQTSTRDCVIMEYLPGKEFTVDCFTNSKGKLLCSFAREREEIRFGVSYKNTEPDIATQSKINEIAEIINRKIVFSGLWFFQVKYDIKNNLKLLEVCPRMATSMGYTRHKGVNLPLLTVFDSMGFDIELQQYHQNIVLYRTTVNKIKYDFIYNHVYIDLDDTIILNGKVNIEAIAFIYQAKSEGKKVYLLSKHEFSIKETLDRYLISEKLFDKIFLLKMEELKSDFIEFDDSIFIDNFYFERNEVYKKKNIPVFDVDSIKSLINSL